MGKGVLTFRIVTAVAASVAAIAGVMAYVKADFRDEFYPNVAGVRLEERVQGLDKAYAILSVSCAAVSDSQASLAKQLSILQEREIHLGELIRAIQEEVRANKK